MTVGQGEAALDVLITAGATRNPVDAVRVLTANASGRTGVAIGAALAARGAKVHVLGSPEAALRAEMAGLPFEVYGSTRDLLARMRWWVEGHPAGHVVHSCAVGDYETVADKGTKLPSGRGEVVLRLTPTPKIADQVRDWGLSGTFVTFKAAAPGTTDEELVDIARRQRVRTRCDHVFANVLGRLQSGVWLVADDALRFEVREEAIAELASRIGT